MVGRSELRDDSKNRRTGGARRRNSIRMTSAISKLPQIFDRLAATVDTVPQDVFIAYSEPGSDLADGLLDVERWTEMLRDVGFRSSPETAVGNSSDPSLRIEPCDADSRFMPTARLWLPALELSCRCVSERCAQARQAVALFRPTPMLDFCAVHRVSLNFDLGEIARWRAAL